MWSARLSSDRSLGVALSRLLLSLLDALIALAFAHAPAPAVRILGRSLMLRAPWWLEAVGWPSLPCWHPAFPSELPLFHLSAAGLPAAGCGEEP
jgi:hypothetical protein